MQSISAFFQPPLRALSVCISFSKSLLSIHPVSSTPKDDRKETLLQAGCSVNKEHHRSSTCLVGFQRGDDHIGGTPPPPRWDHRGFGGGILLDDTCPLHLWQGRSQRGEPVHSRGAAGSPAREPAFVPCPTLGHSIGIVPGLPGKMGGVPCEIFPYSKTASELGSKEGTIQTFEKIHIHTPSQTIPTVC